MKRNIGKFLALIGLFLFHNSIEAKIRILTFHYNKHEFIELQYKAFKKFLLDEYELIVFNDGDTAERDAAIRDMCARYDIPCIRYEQEWHKTDPLNSKVLKMLQNPKVYSHILFASNTIESIAKQPSVRHCHVIQYALDHFGYEHDDIVVIVDGDLFPIRPVSIRSMLCNYDIAGIERRIAEDGVDYLWVPFVAFNMPGLPNKRDLKFHVDVINNKLYDTGAHSYHYLKQNPEVRFKKVMGFGSTGSHYLNYQQILLQGFLPREALLIKTLPYPLCVEFHMDHRFLHYGASSFGLEGDAIKTQYTIDFINKITGL